MVPQKVSDKAAQFRLAPVELQTRPRASVLWNLQQASVLRQGYAS